MSGNSLGEKIWGALKRKMMGESLFLTYFQSMTDGEVGFAGSYPGRIQVFELAAGHEHPGAARCLLLAQSSVQLNIASRAQAGCGLLRRRGLHS